LALWPVAALEFVLRDSQAFKKVEVFVAFLPEKNILGSFESIIQVKINTKAGIILLYRRVCNYYTSFRNSAWLKIYTSVFYWLPGFVLPVRVTLAPVLIKYAGRLTSLWQPCIAISAGKERFTTQLARPK
jgi:hypothetical protein